MKKILPLSAVMVLFCFFRLALAQQQEIPFTGAIPKLQQYKAIYVLNSDDNQKIMGVLGNIKNAINDPRLKGKLAVELIVFGAGVKLYDKAGPFESVLKSLKARGVILAECENTLVKRHIDKKTLYPFISYVPSATGEIIIRSSEGWAVVHF
ncbi:DsrE family protein [Pedobacter cryophilus]|uniref:Uncharacterized protein n=1 Tax=Pedobacter cryophilus TaxID=2571271 RepID=A0A4U1BVF2_9SPHI|nr:DsrE family protein [Pedobacter cryophilus]TKB96765.1 hypothetical protein FA046_11820 [Pedobacter cryophilus]